MTRFFNTTEGFALEETVRVADYPAVGVRDEHDVAYAMRFDVIRKAGQSVTRNQEWYAGWSKDADTYTTTLSVSKAYRVPDKSFFGLLIDLIDIEALDIGNDADIDASSVEIVQVDRFTRLLVTRLPKEMLQ